MTKLLLDPETGRVLRCDDQVTISQRLLDSHPFIVGTSAVYFAGPDAPRAARKITNGGDYVVLERVSSCGDDVVLQRIEEG